MTDQPKPAVTVGCSARVLRREDHAPHNWEPQPGMNPVRCPGYWVEKSPGTAVSAPESHETPLSGIERRPGGEFGPQTGAQSLDTRPAPDAGLREQLAGALTAAAYECDGNCGLSERECYDAHPITFSAMSMGTTHVTGAVTAIADICAAVRDRELEQLRDELERLRERNPLISDQEAELRRQLELVRAERNETKAAIARVEALAGRLELAQYGVDLEADSIRRAIARDVRAALDQLNALAARWEHGHDELTDGCALCRAEYAEVHALIHGQQQNDRTS